MSTDLKMAAVLHALQIAALRRERVFRDRHHPLDVYDDQQMFKLYRFTRQGCLHIIDMISDRLEHRTRRNRALSPSLQVFLSLRYYATGSVMDDTRCIHGVHLSTASRTIRRVTLALCELKDEVIKFPETLEKVRDTQVSFFEVAGFPNIVGAIDGTHVNLHGAPLGEEEYIYVNRKGRHSINVQLICNTQYKITNVVARWPGSTHDSRILRNSAIGQRFANGELQGILLGDSGYRLERWLMTPVRDPHTEAERRYNRAHCRTRVVIEMVNGQLKNKLRCLIASGLQLSPERACDVIVACCVLHNVSKDLREPNYHEGGEEDVELPPIDQAYDPVGEGAATRRDIIDTYFT
ncbi:putative nuclease HARBI1 [Lytechinus variegatus]|uniref:putative nuclease HARBI1 n=2 Tax=Lytechinus variegatus TaxID=7654 RepID=UPI001BB2293A|nr:putative nuclease HARBI1 [Lytechinus variegatus]XP_041476524.1 putative nuclease HARBI1 [Lytechinus variegatus]